MFDAEKRKMIERSRYLNKAVDVVSSVKELLTRDLHTFSARFENNDNDDVRINFTIIGETGRSYRLHIFVSFEELSYEYDNRVALVFSRMEKEFNLYDKHLK